ncbi:hypothetical protein FACS189440_17970 [Bacteroidia bacterium]|nr:hypothetical protein FACS189440_17970 [Bacteroidia bacterium]
METKLTEQQSLSVINEMINRAQNNIKKGSGNYMIFWGYLVSATALLNIAFIYLLVYSSKSPNLSFWVWLIMIPGLIISKWMQRKIDRESIVKTHIDDIIASTWNAFMFAGYLFVFIIFVLSFSTHVYVYFYLINPVLLLFMGVSEYVTAKACRFKPFFYGAISSWTGAVACMCAIIFFTNGVAVQMLILAVCMVIGYVIPGIKLNKKAEEHV